MCTKSIIGYACSNCLRPTNHSIVSVFEEMPDFNYAKLKCVSCSHTFGVRYSKNEENPSSNSDKFEFPQDNESEYPESIYTKE